MKKKTFKKLKENIRKKDKFQCKVILQKNIPCIVCGKLQQRKDKVK